MAVTLTEAAARHVTRSPARNPIGSANSGEADERTVPLVTPAYLRPARKVTALSAVRPLMAAMRRPTTRR